LKTLFHREGAKGAKKRDGFIFLASRSSRLRGLIF